VSDAPYFRSSTRVDAVEKTAQGLSAGLHGERLRVDVVRADVVRFAISRGGVFDERPSSAVSADLAAVDVPFTVEEAVDSAGGRVTRRSGWMCTARTGRRSRSAWTVVRTRR
jgi:hypothetical protein